MPSFRQAFFNALNSQRRVRKFTPEEQERVYEQYRESIGLTQDITKDPTGKTLITDTAVDTHAEKRIKDHTGFKTQFGPKEEDTLAKLLQGNSREQTAVKVALGKVLQPQDFYTDAKNTYKESMDFFKKRVNQVPELSVEKLRGYLEHINERARKALEAKREIELKKLEDAAPELAKNIGSILGISDTDTEGLKKIEDDLIADLKKSHDDQLAEFNKTATENLTVLDKASALERKRLIFSGLLQNGAMQLSEQQKNEMLQEMMMARERNREKRKMEGVVEEGGLEVIVGDEENTISAVNPDDLNFIISITGSKITQQKKEGEPGVWSVHLSHRILSPFYYLNFNQNPKAEMLTMAQAVRASGHDSITMTINFEDPATQKQRAREAYEAALETGFSPDFLPGEEEKGEKGLKGIVLKDGKGNVIDPNTLFTPGELKVLHDNAAKTREKLDKLLKEAPRTSPSEETTMQYRKDIDEGRVQERMKGQQQNLIDAELERVRTQDADHEEKVKTALGH